MKKKLQKWPLCVRPYFSEYHDMVPTEHSLHGYKGQCLSLNLIPL